MKINRIIIKNIGPFKHLDIELKGKSVAFIGGNGSGKTLLISSLVDFIHEYFTELGFRDITPPANGLNHTYFRVASPKFLRVGANKGYIWVSGNIDKEEISYLEQYGYSKEELISELNVEESKIPWSENQAKNILDIKKENKKDLRQKMLSESVFFLPANRFEDESWRTEVFFNEDFSQKTWYVGELGRKLELINSLKDNYIWLTNEVLDHYVVNGGNPFCELRINMITSFLSKILEQKTPVLLNVSTNHYDRLSIIDAGRQVVLNSFENLSMGQLTALNLLLNVLRIGNQNKIPTENEGLVIIDEIDAHTTGEIASRVIPEIIKSFPKIQFIITTHDPISVVGIENHTEIKLIELPFGEEILAKDFREIEETRKRLKTTNAEIKNIINNIEVTNKPVLLVEDQHTEIYKIAWLKVHDIEFNETNFGQKFVTKAPFEIISANGHRNLYGFLNRSNFPSTICGKKVLGLFDFDEAYSSFDGLLKENWSRILGNDKDGLYRKHKTEIGISTMILPVPKYRNKIASSIFKSYSCLSIELYFKNKTLGQNHYGINPDKPGRVSKFLGNKAVFWRETINYNKKDFSSFKVLFEKVSKLLELE